MDNMAKLWHFTEIFKGKLVLQDIKMAWNDIFCRNKNFKSPFFAEI